MLERVTQAAQELERTRVAVVAARSDLDAAIVAAVAAGVSQSDIARELGVSRQAVQQIVARSSL